MAESAMEVEKETKPVIVPPPAKAGSDDDSSDSDDDVPLGQLAAVTKPSPAKAAAKRPSARCAKAVSPNTHICARVQ